MGASIKLQMEDWMWTAGLIGLRRLYECDLSDYGLNSIRFKVEDTRMTLTEEHLESFSKRYIRYMIEEFNIVTRDVKRMGFWSNRSDNLPDRLKPAEKDAQIKEAAKQVRAQINEQFKKVDKYFARSPEHERLQQIMETLKNCSGYDQRHVVKQAVEEYEKTMSTQAIKEKLTLNYMKAMIMNPFFGQTSILQPTFNAKSTDEHIAQIEKDFALPALHELRWYDVLRTGLEKERLLPFLELWADDYKPFHDWRKALKKMKADHEIAEYFQSQMLPCSFIDGMHATQSYEEMVFSPLALSKSKAFNFSWDFNRNLPIPISALARLVFLCVPIGMATYNRRLGTEEFNENKRFFGMLLTGRSFDTEYMENESYRSRRKQDATFGEAIIGLFREHEQKAEHIQKQYTFVEVHSEYSAKKTLLDYYHMPLYMADYLHRYGEWIERIKHREQRDAFLRQILQGHDPKLTIFEILRLAIVESNKGGDPKWLAYYALEATRARVQWLLAKKGEKRMQDKNLDSTVWHVYKQGAMIRQRMVKGRQSGVNEENYRAPGSKKLEGLAYRLLNAAKSGDRQEFMDSVFRVYLSASRSDAALPVSNAFLNIFTQDGLDFETISSAFVAGLLGQDRKDAEEKADQELKPEGEAVHE